MKYSNNFILGIMTTNWSVKRISNLLCCNRTIARMYIQKCRTPEEVNMILAAIANLSD